MEFKTGLWLLEFPGMVSKISQGEGDSDKNPITSKRIYLSTHSGYKNTNTAMGGSKRKPLIAKHFK